MYNPNGIDSKEQHRPWKGDGMTCEGDGSLAPLRETGLPVPLGMTERETRFTI